MILPPDNQPEPPPFALEVLRRLPLAEAFYALFGYTAADTVLEALFDHHRGRCYEDKLSFAELVRVLADALTRYQGRGRGAILDALRRQQLSCQARAVYRKLGRLPLPLAEAFLSTLTARLRPLFPAGLHRTELPASLAGLAVVVLDGKKIKKVAKRLLQTRGLPGKLFGGKVMAAYLPAHGLVVALAAEADGEANDIRLMPRVLPRARAAVAGPRLWVVDAQFCDLDQPAAFSQQPGDHFLLRFTLRNSFSVDRARPALSGINRRGQAYRQDWGWMGSAKEPRRIYVRRLVVQRPGQADVIVVTDLLEAGVYPAEDLLEVYLHRWQIENVFQEITEVFALQHLIGCTPGATVFQAALCLVIYNLLQLVRGYLAAGQAEPVKVATLSAEMIFEDLKKDLIGLHEVLRVEELLACLPVVPTEEQLKARLAELLGGLWSARWKKVVNPKPRPHQPPARQSGAHTSVHKVLEEAKQRQPPKLPKRKNGKSSPVNQR
jgi:Transposase DDE domain